MPVKKKTGGKYQKRAKRGTTESTGTGKVPICEEDQRYAYVTKMLGERRLLAKTSDGIEHQCHIPGKFKGKRYWVSIGMLVLLNTREFQDDKSDVIYIYNESEIKRLQKLDELKIFEKRCTQDGTDSISNINDTFVFEAEDDYEIKASSDDEDNESIDLDDL